MPQGLAYFIFDTPAGWVGLLGSARGLRRLSLPCRSARQAWQALGDLSQTEHSPQPFRDLPERLRAYFSGRRTDFPDKLDLSTATAFQRRVWQAARQIPSGQTRSYRWVAEQVGKPEAARAVGQALGANPLPVIIPCHRVLASDGGTGGYSGGIGVKQYLLRLEATRE